MTKSAEDKKQYVNKQYAVSNDSLRIFYIKMEHFLQL